MKPNIKKEITDIRKEIDSRFSELKKSIDTGFDRLLTIMVSLDDKIEELDQRVSDVEKKD